MTEEEAYSHFLVSYKVAYWVMLSRDFFCMLTMVYFQYKAANSQLYFNRLLDLNDKDSTRVALEDFDMLLVSVVPYKAFSRFLNQQHPEMIPYL